MTSILPDQNASPVRGLLQRSQVFGLLLIGDELLSGRRQDKHLPKVIDLLSQRGLALSWMRCVGDDPKRITQELDLIFNSGDIVFSCGGIGSTPDDHTRQCASAALGLPLVLHPQARELILQRGREVAQEKNEVFSEDSLDTQIRLEMGMFPVGAEIIPNPYNRIPGFSFGTVHFMPGFPVMAWPMIEWVLDHQYIHLQKPVDFAEYSVILLEARESALTPLMQQIEQAYPGVRVFSLPSVDHSQYGACIELGVKGPCSLAEQAFAELERRLKETRLKMVHNS